MIDNATDKILPNSKAGEDSADSHGSLDRSVSYCSAQNDITVREQQYPQSNVISQAEPKIGGEQNIHQIFDNSERDALDWLKDFLDAHLEDDITLTDIQRGIFRGRVKAFRGAAIFRWYKCRSKRTAYVIKAALRNYMLDKRERIFSRLLMVRQSPSSASRDTVLFLLDYARFAMLAESEGVFDRHHRSTKGRWTAYWERQPPTKYKKKKTDTSKRNLANRLPIGYEERLAEEMGYDPAIDLLILTGLRPFEIPSVTLARGDFGMLYINIRSAKTPKGKPDRFRRITTDADHPSTARLLAIVDHADFSVFKKGPFRLRLGRVSKKLFGIRVSPRCFRHALAGALKENEGADRTRTSMIFGHEATRSTSGYGNVPGQRRGSGKSKTNPIIAVSSTHEVRETRSPFFRRHNAISKETHETVSEETTVNSDKGWQD
jgi:integrase